MKALRYTASELLRFASYASISDEVRTLCITARISLRKPYIHRGSGRISRCATETAPSMRYACKWPATQASPSTPSRGVPSCALHHSSPASARFPGGNTSTLSHILDDFNGAAENVTSSPCQAAPEPPQDLHPMVKVLTAGSPQEVLQHAQDPSPVKFALLNP
jgi:hypothetical protein